MMKTLSLDFATNTGFCIHEDGEIVTSGCLNFASKKKQNKDLRLKRFKKFLEAFATDVNEIHYEAARSMRNATGLIVLAEFQGILKVFAVENNIEIFPYSAKPIKKFVTGNGNASKEKVIDAVQKRVGSHITNDNEADAIALMLMVNP